MTHKPPTIIVDIDGCIFEHVGKGAALQWSDNMKLLPGVVEKFNEWEAKSAHIILITARKECCRELLERQLRSHRLFWDQLIMGVTSGRRYIYNDEKTPNVPSCFGITLPRNEGFTL